ncbi:MAG TPA: phosphoribosylaminoimidazolesuccinocarboxamide synthase [Acidimicrobiales bacterium]
MRPPCIDLPLAHIHAGKVRDLFAVGDGMLLMVASDRLSAFDVVMAEPVPDKGRVLTAMTAFWFELLRSVPNHVVSLDVDSLPAEAQDERLAGRMMLVRRCEMLPVECIVRGYLAGSGTKEYQATGSVCGVELPPGLREADRLPEPIFTPTTKAADGAHDAPITFDHMVSLVGADLAAQARELALTVYARAAAHGEAHGLLVADTKLEMGLLDGGLVLADEVLTPDSSRLWPAAGWEPGRAQASFDKQPVRDWLEATGWDKSPPPPALPDEVVAATRSRYVEAYERLSGRAFAAWPGHPLS